MRLPYVINAETFFNAGADEITNDQQYVAVVNLIGPVLKYSAYCGPTGTKEIGNRLQALLGNPRVIGAVLLIDSGGGQCAAVAPLADVIQASTKPIIGFGEDLMASAAYFIGSYCDELWSSSDQDIIGSIGTMMAWADVKPAYEKLGVKFHEVYATKSTEKNRDFIEAEKGNYKRLKEGILDPFNDYFHQSVKENRSGKLKDGSEEAFKGGIYQASEALSIGLIDQIGSISEAAKRVVELAKEQDSQSQRTNSKSDMNIKLKSSWKWLNSALGLEAGKDHDVEVTAEMLENLNTKSETEIANLQGQITQLTTEKETLTGTVATLTQERDSFKAQAEEFGKQPGALGGTAGKKEKDAAPDAEQAETEAVLAALPHNKAADNNSHFKA